MSGVLRGLRVDRRLISTLTIVILCQHNNSYCLLQRPLFTNPVVSICFRQRALTKVLVIEVIRFSFQLTMVDNNV